ncbi:archaeosortase family protein ArtF [Thermococcus celer]|uniref:Archaeosortase family protein ArtF n=1 Tax=Thermococcus celer Vu 13 = JCM 8558 TaxID=1293037 RepID=A0A218P368_THECE|nr:archaeosortase family protein ArtF [Thermococcus celer]ASI99370.1 archaeosortase family protein ArtF [Thermococcus celer Vu 13 = JCM 8558]
MKRDSVIFNLLLLLGYLIGFSIVVLVIGAKFGKPLVLIEAKNVHALLSFLGVSNTLLGNMIYLPGERLAFEITWQCSGTFTLSLYTAVYLAFPRIRRNVREWIIGASVIYLLNLLRVAIAIYLYHRSGEGVFNLFHYTIGPAILFGAVVILLGRLLVKSLRAQQD